MISEAIVTWGIPVILLFMVLNGSVSFPPSELVLTLAGALTVTDNVLFLPLLIAITFANFIGTSILYFALFKKGDTLVRKMRKTKFISEHRKLDEVIPSTESLDGLIRWFGRKGIWLVFLCRCIPFVRSAISIPAGISKVPFHIFFALSTLGMFIWALAWMLVGRGVLYSALQGRIGVAVTLLTIVLLLLFVAGKRIRKHLRQQGK